MGNTAKFQVEGVCADLIDRCEESIETEPSFQFFAAILLELISKLILAIYQRFRGSKMLITNDAMEVELANICCKVALQTVTGWGLKR